MKTAIFIFSLLFSSSVLATDGQDLLKALKAAAQEAKVELDFEKIDALQSSSKKDEEGEILVTYKLNQSLFLYGCHYHGSEMACHLEEEKDIQKIDGKTFSDKEGNFQHMQKGYLAALKKLEKTLKRSQQNLKVLESIKVWRLAEKHDDNDDGHEHGADVWTKVVYPKDDKKMTVFIQCHEHHGEKELACHYKREAKDEPKL